MSIRDKLNGIFFVVGVASIVVMFLTFDISIAEMWHDVCQTGWWMVAILLLWLLVYVLNCLSWRYIISGSGPVAISFVRLLRLTISGFAVSYATPGGMMGGEAYRLLELSRHIGNQRAASSVVLYLMMHVYSHFWFWMLGIALCLLLLLIGHLHADSLTWLLLLLSTLFCLGGIYLFRKGYRNGFTLKALTMASRLPLLSKWLSRIVIAHGESLRKVDSQIASLRSQTPRVFAMSFALEYVARLLQCLEIMMIMAAAGTGCAVGGIGAFAWLFAQSLLTLALTSLFANILGFMPMQLGGRECGFALSMSLFGMSPATGLLIGVICRVRELFWTIVGIALMKLNIRTYLKT